MQKVDFFSLLGIFILGNSLFTTGYLLVVRQRAQLLSRMAVMAILIMSFDTFHDVLVNSRFLLNYLSFWGLGGVFDPFFVVFIYLIFRKVQFPKFTISGPQIAHFILPAAYLLYRLQQKWILQTPVEELLVYYAQDSAPFTNWGYLLVDLAFPLFYLILTLRYFKKEGKPPRGTLREKWIILAISVLVIFLLSKAVVYIFPSSVAGQWNWKIWIAIYTLILLAFNYLLIRYPLEKLFPSRYEASRLTSKESTVIMSKVDALIESNALYTKPDLTLNEVASKLNVYSNYLSQAINENKGKNFNEYINHFRINKAKELLRDPEFDKYTIEHIAYSVGFKSRSAFYRSFKLIAGLPPTQFKLS